MTKKQKPRPILPLILVAAGAVLTLGALAFYLFLEIDSTQEQTTLGESSESGSTEVSRVSVMNAKAAYDLGSAVFVDVRTPEAYAESRIPGAVSIPLAELPDRLDELDKQAWIITY
jgi:3-mercaptopyruvate sulfurtransferase SseA